MKNALATDKEIAVLADPELIGALRLAGLRKTVALQAGDADTRLAVVETLQDWLRNEEVGVILVAENLAAMAEDVIASPRKGKRLLPVIVEVPSREGSRHGDAADYYKKLSRDFLGLEIVLNDKGPTTDGTQTGPSKEG